jgi:hypothetical protein
MLRKASLLFIVLLILARPTFSSPITSHVFDDGTSVDFFGFGPDRVVTSFEPAAAVTSLSILGKAGITLLLGILGNLIADQISAWLGIPVKPDTSLTAADFSDKNIATAFLILAYADGGPQKKVGVSNSVTANISKQTVKKTSSKYPGTFAEIGVQRTCGFFSCSVWLGSPPTALEAIAKAPPPTGTRFLEDTQAVAFGFVFANGQFIQIGAQDTDRVLVPEPSVAILVLVGMAGVFGFSRRANRRSRY